MSNPFYVEMKNLENGAEIFCKISQTTFYFEAYLDQNCISFLDWYGDQLWIMDLDLANYFLKVGQWEVKDLGTLAD